jgi:hypothetical protein
MNAEVLRNAAVICEGVGNRGTRPPGVAGALLMLTKAA